MRHLFNRAPSKPSGVGSGKVPEDLERRSRDALELADRACASWPRRGVVLGVLSAMLAIWMLFVGLALEQREG